MRISVLAFLSATLVLSACSESNTPSTPAAFEDNGCIGYILLQQQAIAEGRSLPDAVALEAPLGRWREAGARVLSADELAQYEASSVAVYDDEGAEVIARRASECAINAPR